MKTVKLSEVSSIKMVSGNENKFDYVIHNGVLKFWVGFGWIAERSATKADKKKYPKVIA